jgi:hypothetical protein
MMSKTVNFSTDVRKLREEKGMEFIDAVVHWCEVNNLEVEYAASLIKKDPVILSNIQCEAENLNIIKKTAKLPI